MGVHIDDLGIPVRLLARNIVTTLEDQDPLSGRSQMVGERSSARTGSDDDYVIMSTHDANPPLAQQKMQRLSL